MARQCKNLDNYERTIYENIAIQKKHIGQIEKQGRMRPTRKDKLAAVSVMNDFDMKINESDIPTFYSVFELERWKREKILNYLSKK